MNDPARQARHQVVRGRFALHGIVLPLSALEGDRTGHVVGTDGALVMVVDEPGIRTDAEALEVARLVAEIINRAGGIEP